MTMTAAYSSIKNVPTFADGTAGAAAALFTPTVSGAPWSVNRRIEIENTSAADTLTVLIVATAADLTGKTVAQGRRVMPGKSWGCMVAGSLVVGIVGTATYNAMMSDA